MRNIDIVRLCHNNFVQAEGFPSILDTLNFVTKHLRDNLLPFPLLAFAPIFLHLRAILLPEQPSRLHLSQDFMLVDVPLRTLLRNPSTEPWDLGHEAQELVLQR